MYFATNKKVYQPIERASPNSLLTATGASRPVGHGLKIRAKKTHAPDLEVVKCFTRTRFSIV